MVIHYLNFFYSVLSKKETTQQKIISNISIDNSVIYRNSYISKEKNISIHIYEKIFNEIKNYFNILINNTDKDFLIAIDGTNNSNVKRDIMLNMDIYII